MTFKASEVAGLAFAAALVTAGIGIAQANDAVGRARQAADPAGVEIVASTKVASTKVEAAQATAEQIAQAPTCGRKVKVVYAGYGEGARSDCPTR